MQPLVIQMKVATTHDELLDKTTAHSIRIYPHRWATKKERKVWISLPKSSIQEEYEE